MTACLRMLVLGALLIAALSGCMFRDVTRQQDRFDALCVLSGTVETPHGSDRPIVVLLVRKQGPGPFTLENARLFDHFVREGDGRWIFYTSPGLYGLAAFEDSSRDLVYRPGEPFLRVDADRLVDCQPGTRISDIRLVIPESGAPRFEGPLDITAVQARSIDDQLNLSVGQMTAVGEVVSLDEPRFAESIARSGLWRPFDFLFDGRPGVYFVEPFDAKKVPVLFVHGVNGTPRNFEGLIGALDRSRFQPWVYYYPSGVRLDAVAAHLDETIMKLERRLGFDELLVVAHSMGGLVSRSFILKHHAARGRAAIPLFISIATPWGGHDAAQIGVDHAPAVVRSWVDMAPGSPFLSGLFYTEPEVPEQRLPLPEDVSHHLLFAFQRRSASFGPSDDRVATVASQMRTEAQQDAARLYGFDETHMGILSDRNVAVLINQLLADGVR